MAGYKPDTASIRGEWALDNAGLDIVFNGESLGVTNANGFGVFTPFAITDGFMWKENTLDFVVQNHPPPGPTGLRVRMIGLARPAGRGALLISR